MSQNVHEVLWDSARETIKPWSRRKAAQYYHNIFDRWIALVVADLGIEQVHLAWEWIERAKVRGPYTATCLAFVDSADIAIATHQTTPRTICKNIAHELRHAYQAHLKLYEYRCLGNDKFETTWHGTTFEPPRIYRKLPYDQLPDELDAYAYASDVMRRLYDPALLRMPAQDGAS